MSKVLVLGYFGYLTNQLDGQTVKTRDVYRLVKEQFGECKVDYFDTQEFQNNKMKIFTMFWKIMRCKTLFYLPAHNNLKVLFPMIYCMSVIFRVKIHYFVVGGWLREFLTHLPVHRYMLRRISGIHAETKRLRDELGEYYHFTNVDTFPNFRFFDFNPLQTDSNKLRIVFMARVMKQKGIDWIFALADYIVENGLQEKFSITFFGSEVDEDHGSFI